MRGGGVDGLGLWMEQNERWVHPPPPPPPPPPQHEQFMAEAEAEAEAVVGRGRARGEPASTALLLGARRRKRGRRGRCLVLLGLVCCSPVLLPLALFFSFPLLCVVLALCVRAGSGAPVPACGGGAGSCREGGAAPLLQRYLEDQLGLVGSVGWSGGGVGGEGDGGGVGEGSWTAPNCYCCS